MRGQFKCKTCGGRAYHDVREKKKCAGCARTEKGCVCAKQAEGFRRFHKKMGYEKRAPATCGLCGRKDFRDDEEYAKHLETYGHKVLFHIAMRG